uniref:Uncharacterized protein n=1 Tax=Panagrolaimus sp. JU765 TaxID=591449 RepID=A0AC34RP88_9BILA
MNGCFGTFLWVAFVCFVGVCGVRQGGSKSRYDLGHLAKEVEYSGPNYPIGKGYKPAVWYNVIPEDVFERVPIKYKVPYQAVIQTVDAKGLQELITMKMKELTAYEGQPTGTGEPAIKKRSLGKVIRLPFKDDDGIRAARDALRQRRDLADHDPAAKPVLVRAKFDFIPV